MIKIFIHPERLENEIFFTNCSLWQFENIKFNSKRKGDIAYDGNGEKLNLDDWFPVFIKVSELIATNKTLVEARNLFRESVRMKI